MDFYEAMKIVAAGGTVRRRDWQNAIGSFAVGLKWFVSLDETETFVTLFRPETDISQPLPFTKAYLLSTDWVVVDLDYEAELAALNKKYGKA